MEALVRGYLYSKHMHIDNTIREIIRVINE